MQQVYEETAGLTVGDVVTRTKKVRAGSTVIVDPPCNHRPQQLNNHRSSRAAA
jgi:hypothetical protein